MDRDGNSTARLGIGEVSPALAAARGVEAREIERVVATAIEMGVDLVEVDGADRDALKMVGGVVKELRARDRVQVVTKIGPGRELVREVEEQLRASGLEVLSRVQLVLRAGAAKRREWPGLVETCTRLVRDGKVLAWGAWLDDDDARAVDFTQVDRDDPEYADAVDLADVLPMLGTPFATVSVPFALCDRGSAPLIDALARGDRGAKPAAGLEPLAIDPAMAAALVTGLGDEAAIAMLGLGPVPAAGTAGEAPKPVPVAVHARRVFAGGALAGTFAPGMKLAPKDDRRGTLDVEAIAVRVAELAALVEIDPPAVAACVAAKTARERAGRRKGYEIECQTVAELALRYALGRAGIARVLPRVHRAAHVAELVVWSAKPGVTEQTYSTLAAW